MALETVPLRQLGMNLVPMLTYDDELDVIDLPMRLYNDTGADRKLTKLRASVAVPSEGSSIQVDILRNGTSILGGDYLEIPAGSYSDALSLGTGIAWNDGQYLTASIVQVGSTFAGEGLVVNVAIAE